MWRHTSEPSREKISSFHSSLLCDLVRVFNFSDLHNKNIDTLGVVVSVGANPVKSFLTPYAWSSVPSAPLTPRDVTAPSFVPFGPTDLYSCTCHPTAFAPIRLQIQAWESYNCFMTSATNPSQALCDSLLKAPNTVAAIFSN